MDDNFDILQKKVLEETPIKPAITKNFFQEVYMCEGEYLYVEVRASSERHLTTRGEGKLRGPAIVVSY